MTPDNITNNLKSIQSVLNIQCSPDDPYGVMDKINQLTNVMGLAAECHAEAEQIYNLKLGQLYGDYDYQGLSATDKKMMFQGKLANEIKLMTLAEQYSKKLDKMVEALRTVVSFAKNEQRQMQ